MKISCYSLRMSARIAPSDELLALARALRSLRRERDLSQEAVALAAGIHPKHLSDIERANKDPRATTVVRLAEALGVGVAELYAMPDRPTQVNRGTRRA